MSETLPTFKYFADPLGLEVFEVSDEKCEVCGKSRGYVYEGGIHTDVDVDAVCPWCIADGSAAKKLDGYFIDPDLVEEPYSEDSISELITRTPCYIGWQDEQWLSHCEEPCRFEAYVGSKEIVERKIDVKEDLKAQAELYELSEDEFKEELVNEGPIQGYLFQCVKCGTYRLTTDCD